MAERILVCDVTWDAKLGAWCVSCRAGLIRDTTYPTKEQAVFAARQVANRLRPCMLKVHRQDGTLENEFGYR